MADALQTTALQTSLPEPTAPARPAIVFSGETRNMAMGIAMLGGGIAAFIAGLTHTFFAQALAYTFIAWGIFFLYGDLLLATRRLIVTDEALEIRIPFRFWNRSKSWAWQHIYRLDIVIDRRTTHAKDTAIHIYHQFPGEVAIDREDTNFDPELAALVIERARLKPDGEAAKVDLNDLPLGASMTLTWKR
ncbi:MAG TPA: hypothetical protein GX400_03705 [Chloroflexi bacterium]|nr:hypothetical protein [Chloroflexota bacterium]